MDPLDSPGDESERGWVDPDDRLWRHPSEIGASLAARTAAPATRPKSPNAWAVAGLAGAIGALLTAGLIAAVGGFSTRELPVRSVEHVAVGQNVSARLSDSTDPAVAVAQKLRPSIVQVTGDTDSGKVSGSGVVFRDDGHILTNHHVVDGASNVKVIAADGRALDARIVGSDEDTDIAVLKVNAEMPAATLGSVRNVQVGEQAIAIGSPLGLEGGPSVTVGVVSALDRPFDTPDGPLLVDMIQTDAPISPGSSGGALVDAAGNVIGITTGIAVGGGDAITAQGLGFATPIDIARDVAEQIVTTGKVVHIWLGVRGEDLDPAMAKTLGVDGGALVREVVSGSPAARAGIKSQDVIMTVNGKPVQSMADVVVSVRGRKAGDSVKVTVWRGLHAHTFTVVLQPRD
ncbi:MAG TPA: trypsin-like peptidase domain-containing protein [Acidimicrobiales bacterium]|nr:trypsin-like peptidase domain-containing protein [Acidimicrobiales bacterium]